MKIALTAISLIAIAFIATGNRPAYSQVETTVVKTTTVTPTVTKEIIVTPGVVVLGAHIRGWSVANPSIDARRHELELRIAQDVVDNKITTNEEAILRNHIDALVALEANLMQPKGFLTDQEARILFVKYDRLGSALDQFVAGNSNALM